jgi:hypothetical protein
VICLPSRALEGVQALAEFQFLLDFANETCGGIALSVLQHDQALALECWLKLLDLVKVDDDRAADAQESLRGKMGFQRSHTLAQDTILLWPVRRATDMHYQRICLRASMAWIWSNSTKVTLPRRFDSQSCELTRRRWRLT